MKIINNFTIVCYPEQTTMTEDQLRIAIPPSMIDEVVRWYQLVLGHPRNQRLHKTINARFSYPGFSTIWNKINNTWWLWNDQESRKKHGLLVSREVNKQHSNIATNLGRPYWRPWTTIVNGTSATSTTHTGDSKHSEAISVQQIIRLWLSRSLISSDLGEV